MIINCEIHNQSRMSPLNFQNLGLAQRIGRKYARSWKIFYQINYMSTHTPGFHILKIQALNYRLVSLIGVTLVGILCIKFIFEIIIFERKIGLDPLTPSLRLPCS